MNTISSTTTSSISNLQLTTAKTAFVNDKKINSKEQQEEFEESTPIESINPRVTKVDVEDIQKYANYMGENLSIDDINYGLRYGRSVIADYLA